MRTICICDDDKNIVEAIELYCLNEGYKTITCYNGQELLNVVETVNIDLLVLDIMMPKVNGLEVIKQLRPNYNFPIIFLSAKSQEMDKIIGLTLGADDYITKPFSSLELMARIKSQLRRASIQFKVKENQIIIGGIVLDDQSKEVMVDDELVKVTPIEFKILKYLMSHPNQVLSAEQIYLACWNEEGYDISNTIAVHIRHLREKIEINPKDPRYLKIVWGLGYKFEKEEK